MSPDYYKIFLRLNDFDILQILTRLGKFQVTTKIFSDPKFSLFSYLKRLKPVVKDTMVNLKK